MDPFRLRKPPPTIAGTGLVALDIVLNSDPARLPRVWAGGTCANVLTILSFFGWVSYPIARLNGDPVSKRVFRDLKRWGVKLDYAGIAPATDAPLVVERLSHDDAGHMFHRFLSGYVNYSPVSIDMARTVLERLATPTVFFLDRVSPGALALARGFAAKGALIVFEPSASAEPRHLAEALALCHILKYAHERSGEVAELAVAAAPLLEIETRGREGLRFRSRIETCRTDDWVMYEAYAVRDFRDGAGAGDWCTAGLIHRLGQEGVTAFRRLSAAHLREALDFGQALGAWTCGSEGARGGMYKSSAAVVRRTLRQSVTSLASAQRPGVRRAVTARRPHRP